MPAKMYVDTESCGLYGHAVLIQYAVEDGPIILYEPWRKPVRETLALIEWMLTHTLVFFNAAFDMFLLSKLYTTFRLCDPDLIPETDIDGVASKEIEAMEGPCLKPAGVLDLMLHARKGPYQSLMARDPVRIKRVPNSLACALAQELEQLIEFDGIYFAKTKDKNAPRWKVLDRKKRDGNIDKDFKDVVLKFNPAGGLKFLAEHALGLQPKYHFKDVEVNAIYRPVELGYAPFACALSSADKGWYVAPKKKANKKQSKRHYAWPGVIKYHIEHWATNLNAREYAKDDIVYTRALDKHFGCPEPNDNDSVLAAMVAVVRWHGFQIDIPGIQTLKAVASAVVAKAPVNCNKPKDIKAYINAVMDETEKLVSEFKCVGESTKKSNLEALASDKWNITEPEPCTLCQNHDILDSFCHRCNNTGILQVGPHPVSVRAKEILDIKIANKEIELYAKLLVARKLHASFVVIGTKSSRMSGADGLNPQGIKHSKEVRRLFPLAWEGMVLSLGDFDAFEVTLADAVYKDPQLRADLLSGNSIHANFAVRLFGVTLEEVKASKGTANDMYTKGKQGIFAMLYGGTWETLTRKLNVTQERAMAAFAWFAQAYPEAEKTRRKISDAFCSMRQENNKQVIWREPAEYSETFLGFRRYFTLENKICRALFDLAHKPPKEWRDCKVKVVRRDRVQTASGAVQSALFGAAFGMQNSNQRAAGNNVIQSPGAEITKTVQRKVWDLQPVGINDWDVLPMNVHDEVEAIHRPELTELIKTTVLQTVESFREQVPLIGMEWKTNLKNWSDK